MYDLLQVFSFPPEFVLKAGGKVSVLSGRNATPPEDEIGSMDFFITKKFLWNAKGDVALLKNTEGDVVSSYAEGVGEDEYFDEFAGERGAADGVRISLSFTLYCT